MIMETGSLKSTQNIIKALVLSVPEKMTIERLNKDYRDTEGENIPFHRMGYKTLEAFLRSMPQIVQVCGNGKTAFVINVTSDKTKHMEELVQQQKKTKVRKYARPINNVYRNGVSLSNVNYNYQRPNKNLMMDNNTSYGQWNAHHGNYRNHSQGFTKSVQRAQSLRFTNNRSGYLNSANQNLSEAPSTMRLLQHQPTTHNQIEQNQLITQLKNATLEEKPVKASLPKLNLESNSNVRLTHLHPNRPTRNELAKFSEENYLKDESVKPYKEIIKTNQLIIPASKDAIPHPIADLSDYAPVESKNKHKTIEADEAIPDYALNSGVFLADFPPEVARFGMDFFPTELPTIQSVIAVSVAQIDAPDRFYFQIRKKPDEFEIMHNDMQHFYEVHDNSAYKLPPHCIKAGLLCTVRERGVWKRAKILTPPDAEKRVKVSIVDFGTTRHVEQHELRFLLKLYIELPVQALCGRLSFLTTSMLSGNWPMETIRFFRTLTCDRVLFGKVTAVNKQTNQTDLILCDTTGTRTKQINSLLISQGYAVYNDEKQVKM